MTPRDRRRGTVRQVAIGSILNPVIELESSADRYRRRSRLSTSNLLRTMHIRSLCSATLIVATLLLAGPAPAAAQPRIRSFGFGASFGDPFGITLKGSAGGSNAWDAALGRSWFGNLRIHVDYLWNVNVFNSSKAGMYFGVGGIVGFGRGNGVFIKGKGNEWYYYEDKDATAVGARVVAGVNFMPFTAPVELFLDVAPVIGLAPSTGVGTELAFGVRYYP